MYLSQLFFHMLTLKALMKLNETNPVEGSKVDSAFHPSGVDKMSTRNSGNLVVKGKLSPGSGSSLDTVEPVHRKGP